MKNKKVFLCIMGLLLAGILCGCSLAVPEVDKDGESDRLIGVFITAKYLNLSDREGNMNDYASQTSEGAETEADNNAKGEEKLYATIEKNGGTDPSEWNISFGKTEGINMFSPLTMDQNGERFWGNVLAEEVCDTDVNINVTDSGEEYSMSGTIYILPEKADGTATYYINPVYQTVSGDIYVVPGQGYSTNGETSEGEGFSSTLSDETTTANGGKTKIDKSSITVNIQFMYKPVGISLCQMNGDNQIVKQESYKPGQVPKKLKTEPETEYILAATEKESFDGEKIVSREVYEKNQEDYLCTPYPMEAGTVAKQETEVEWGK